MSRTRRALVVAITLAVTLSPAVQAGGMSASVEGPFKDGSYLARTFQCSVPASLNLKASAEGLVNGQRKLLPLTLTATKVPGTYAFEHAWPIAGRWVVRLAFAGGRGPVTVASFDAAGRVRDNALVWSGEGRHECDALLAAAIR